MDREATIVRQTLCYLLVCVPELWTDAEILTFASHATQHAWDISDATERILCDKHADHVHVTLSST